MKRDAIMRGAVGIHLEINPHRVGAFLVFAHIFEIERLALVPLHLQDAEVEDLHVVVVPLPPREEHVVGLEIAVDDLLPVHRVERREHLPDDLARAVEQWIGLQRDGRHPRSEGMSWITWSQSAQQMADILLHRAGAAGPSR